MAQQTITPEDEAFLKSYEDEIEAGKRAGLNSTMPYSAAMFAGQPKQNLVEWELDFSKELVEIERLLRSDILVTNKNGNQSWQPNPDSARRLFNDLGTQDLLRFVFTLVNKNKVLSNYNADEIRQRVHLIKHELRTQIYNNYEQYGIDNEYKMNNYSMVVHIIGSLIEDAYRRAMNGETHRGLGESRFVQQNEPMMPQNINTYAGMQQKRGFLSKALPWNWGRN